MAGEHRLEHGAELWSFDRDFARFPGLVFRHLGEWARDPRVTDNAREAEPPSPLDTLAACD